MQSFTTANKINPYLPKTVKSRAKSRKSVSLLTHLLACSLKYIAITHLITSQVVEEFYKKQLEKSEAEKSMKYMEGTSVSMPDKLKGIFEFRVWKASTQEVYSVLIVSFVDIFTHLRVRN